MHEREQVPTPAVHDDTTPRAVALGLQPVLNSRDGVRDGTNRVQRLLTERDHQFGARVDELGSQGRSPRFRTGGLTIVLTLGRSGSDPESAPIPGASGWNRSRIASAWPPFPGFTKNQGTVRTSTTRSTG